MKYSSKNLRLCTIVKYLQKSHLTFRLKPFFLKQIYKKLNYYFLRENQIVTKERNIFTNLQTMCNFNSIKLEKKRDF